MRCDDGVLRPKENNTKALFKTRVFLRNPSNNLIWWLMRSVFMFCFALGIMFLKSLQFWVGVFRLYLSQRSLVFCIKLVWFIFPIYLDMIRHCFAMFSSGCFSRWDQNFKILMLIRGLSGNLPSSFPACRVSFSLFAGRYAMRGRRKLCPRSSSLFVLTAVRNYGW